MAKLSWTTFVQQQVGTLTNLTSIQGGDHDNMISPVCYFMEPVVSRTDCGNCYLYSAVKKSLMTLPFDVYEDIIKNGSSRSVVYNQIEKFGYLLPWHESFEGLIYADDISNSLTNITQVVFETTTACNLCCKYCC